MDADNFPVRQAVRVQGGTVEPANRAPVAIERFQTPTDTTGECYEMRDPFAEVTYRANTLPEMVAKADQLGSTRYSSISTRRFRPRPLSLLLSATWSPTGWYVARMRAGSTPAATR